MVTKTKKAIAGIDLVKTKLAERSGDKEMAYIDEAADKIREFINVDDKGNITETKPLFDVMFDEQERDIIETGQKLLSTAPAIITKAVGDLVAPRMASSLKQYRKLTEEGNDTEARRIPAHYAGNIKLGSQASCGISMTMITDKDTNGGNKRPSVESTIAYKYSKNAAVVKEAVINRYMDYANTSED